MNMNKLQNWIAGIALGGVVILTGVIFTLPEPVQNIQQIVKEQLGAVASPDMPFKYLTVGGVTTYYESMPFRTGTTTVCSIPVPTVASTTVISAGMRIDGVPTTTTGARWKIYTGVGQNSTTTLLAGMNVTATGTAIVATTSLTTDSVVMATGDNYIVFDFEGGSNPYLGMGGQTGQCTVEFRAY